MSRKGKEEAAVVMNAKVRCPEGPVDQAKESPVNQANVDKEIGFKEEIEYWLELSRLLVDSSDKAQDQLEKLIEKREEKLKEIGAKEDKMDVCNTKDELELCATKDEEQEFCAAKDGAGGALHSQDCGGGICQ